MQYDSLRAFFDTALAPALARECPREPPSKGSNRFRVCIDTFETPRVSRSLVSTVFGHDGVRFLKKSHKTARIRSSSLDRSRPYTQSATTFSKFNARIPSIRHRVARRRELERLHEDFEFGDATLDGGGRKRALVDDEAETANLRRLFG